MPLDPKFYHQPAAWNLQLPQARANRDAKEHPHARKHHQPRIGLRDLPRRLPGRLGRGLARPRDTRAAGRLANRLRNIHHRWRRDHHRRSCLLRDARHVLAARLRQVTGHVASDPHSEGHRRVRGEDRREALLPHAHVRGGRLRIGDPRGGDMPLLGRHRGRRRGVPRHVRIHTLLARRVLAAVRDARREVRAPSDQPPPERPKAPLREPDRQVAPAHRGGKTHAQGEEDRKTKRSRGQ